MSNPTLLELARKVRDSWIRERISDTMRLAEGNVTQAARLSGMDVANFRRLARRVGYAKGDDWTATEARYRAAFAALNAEDGAPRRRMLREAQRGGRKSKAMRGAK